MNIDKEFLKNHYFDFVIFEGSSLKFYKLDGGIDTDGSHYPPVEVKGKCVFSYLKDICLIKEGTTLGHIFDYVAGNDVLKEFIAAYSHCAKITEFHNQSAKEEQNNGKLDYLEISKRFKFIKPRNRKNKTVSDNFVYIFDNIDFYGIGNISKIEPEERNNYFGDEKGNISYSVSYSPMNELTFLPIRIKERCDVFYFDEFTKNKTEYTSKFQITLLEFLDAIYNDISFMGGPEDNEKFLNYMKDVVDGINSGEIETIPFNIQEELDILEEKLKEDQEDNN